MLLFSAINTPSSEARPPITCMAVLAVAAGSWPVTMAAQAAREAQVEGSTPFALGGLALVDIIRWSQDSNGANGGGGGEEHHQDVEEDRSPGEAAAGAEFRDGPQQWYGVHVKSSPLLYASW
ncbi:MAG: hypothetical protein H7834_10850 [Magnetococcus sp. YQC-9]